MIPLIYTRLQLAVMHFYGIRSRSVPVIKAIAMAYEGEPYVCHDEVKDNLLQMVGNVPRNPYDGLSMFVEYFRWEKIVELHPVMLAVIDCFTATDCHYLIRIGEDTEKLGYKNHTIRRGVDEGKIDGFVVDRTIWKEHYICIPEYEVRALKKMYNCVEKNTYCSRNSTIIAGNPVEILSLLEKEGHGNTWLAEKVKMWLNEKVLPSHIMYDIRKLL